MNAKEKALDLLNKYYNLLNPNFPHINVLWKDCKKCALIAVDEIINLELGHDDIAWELDKYWQEVKQEIEKL